MIFAPGLIALIPVVLVLAACNQHIDEKTSARKSNVNDAETTDMTQRKLPQCAQRNKDGTYKSGGGCSAEEWIEWQKTQDAMIAPSK